MEESNSENDTCKLYLDLWRHHDTNIWNKLQPIGITQMGFFGLAGYLSTNSKISIVEIEKYSLLVCSILLFYFVSQMINERAIRDNFRKKIESLDLDIYPGSIRQLPYDKDISGRYYEYGFMLLIYCIFAGIDLYAGFLLGLPTGIAVGFGIFYFLAFFLVDPKSSLSKWVDKKFNTFLN